MGKKTVVMQAAVILPNFSEFVIPRGYLADHPSCFALFEYALMATRARKVELEGLIYEGEDDPQYDYRQLFRSIAWKWGVPPESMVHYWPNVDMQFVAAGTSKVPEELRFAKVPSVKTRAN